MPNMSKAHIFGYLHLAFTYVALLPRVCHEITFSQELHQVHCLPLSRFDCDCIYCLSVIVEGELLDMKAVLTFPHISPVAVERVRWL